MSNALSLRRAVDAERLQLLAARSNGKIALEASATAGSPRFVIELAYATAANADYPRSKQARTRLVVDLPSRYPFQPPVATITTAIFHPNVFASGVVCLGSKWMPSEGMDLFVLRVARLICFDALLVNPHSAANRDAMSWYVHAQAQRPQAFPSDIVDPSLLQDPVIAPPDRVIVACTHCHAQLRLPRGRSGNVRCPQCTRDFVAST
jgi:Ubiquitin-conjugating enzyme